ncbi:FAD-dependent oxidoreductase, partial [Nocardioides sp.]|uniref:NAD(P)/FAD-dependent oxidoreductase n=1 Tax=Nocardioides sp. TaxID=35761 RepID=UPI0025FCE142
MNQNDGPTSDRGTDASATDPSEHDVVVVGGGAAGLSAALVLGRSRRSVAVVDAGEPRNAPAAHMQGFLGSDGLPPAELLARGRAEVAGYGVDLIAGTVTGIARCEVRPLSRRRFRVTLADGRILTARRVLVTTGLRDVVPDLPGLAERWGRDLLHCPYCHGHEVRDQPLGVLVGGETPLEESLAYAHLIRQWSDDVVLFANGTSLSVEHRERLVARAIGVVDAPVTRLVVEDDRLTGVETADGHVVARSAVFVRP